MVVVSALLTVKRANVRLVNKSPKSVNGGDGPSFVFFQELLRGPNEIMDVEVL